MQEYAFKNVFCKMAVILPKSHYVNVSTNICCNSIYVFTNYAVNKLT